MNQSGKKLAIILFILLWLFAVSLPALAFILATSGQIHLGIGNSNNERLRVFLLQEKEVEGIGFELARPYKPMPACIQTSVRYFMWRGEPENVTFCQCFERDSAAAHSATPGTCHPP